VRVELAGTRVLVAGATGVLGGAVARALHEAGAPVALAGRDEDRLAALAQELGDAPSATFDALDLGRCAAVVGEAADALGGLDLLVVAIGVAAFATPWLRWRWSAPRCRGSGRAARWPC
jgi:NADP-dependent 3-hydroxy acid dehydrogenase YdfG